MAPRISKFGDLGIVEGKWPRIGRMPGWDRRKWRTPRFKRAVRVLTGAQLCTGGSFASAFAPSSRVRSVERIVRDARLMEIGEGTSEIQRIVIARELLRAAS